MGSNMARNFAHHGYTVALHNQSIGKTDALLAEHGSEGNFVRSETIPEFLCRAGETAAGLGLTGAEQFDIVGVADGLTPGGSVTVRARPDAPDGAAIEFQAVARIDTPEELVAFRHGGILPYVMRQLVGKKTA